MPSSPPNPGGQAWGQSPGSRRRSAGAVLLLRVGEAPCCVDLAQVEELAPLPEMVRVPLAPPAVLGLFNHRSEVATALSLRRPLGVQEWRSGERFLILSRSDTDLVGFEVDEISDILHPDPGDWREVPPHLSLDFCDRILVQPGRLYALVDLDRLRLRAAQVNEAQPDAAYAANPRLWQSLSTGSLADLEVSPRRAAHDPEAAALVPSAEPDGEEDLPVTKPEPPQEPLMEPPESPLPPPEMPETRPDRSILILHSPESIPIETIPATPSLESSGEAAPEPLKEAEPTAEEPAEMVNQEVPQEEPTDQGQTEEPGKLQPAAGPQPDPTNEADSVSAAADPSPADAPPSPSPLWKYRLIGAILVLGTIGFAAWYLTPGGTRPKSPLAPQSLPPLSVPPDPGPSVGGTELPISRRALLYTVLPGDSLSKLAARFLGDWRRYPELVEENEVENPDLILVDDELRIPREEQ